MITPMQAADAVTYLAASGATMIRDHQGQVWADWINDQIPGALPADLAPAAREAFRRWKDDGRRWQIDMGHLTDAIRAIRQKRYDEATRLNPLLPEGIDDATQSQQWIDTASELIRQGRPRGEAEQTAWRHVGLLPPAPQPPRRREVEPPRTRRP